MSFFISLVIGLMIFIVLAINSAKKYKRSSDDEKMDAFAPMIKSVLYIFLFILLIIGESFKLYGFSMEEIKPIIFIAAILIIFIPGYLCIGYTLFNKAGRKDFNDISKYGFPFLYKYRKLLTPIIVLIPVIMVSFLIYQLGKLAF